VDSLLQAGIIPDDSAESVLSHFSGRVHQMEDVIDHAAKVLSSLTQYTAVVLSPKGNEPKIQTIQLVPVSAESALVVIVTDQGLIRDSIIRISSEVDSDTLYQISRTLTNELRGSTLSRACEILPEMTRRMEGNDEVLHSLYGFFNEGKTASRSAHVAIGGTSNMLSYPEYSDVDKARNFLSLMETRDKLADIIRGSGEMAFTVRIGPETGVPEMADCSIVTASYSTRSGQQGTIGVIGPTRMRYSRVISILNMMGHELTDMFSGEDEGKRSP
jgi:heat-inducible transcriptional repressor